MIESDSPLLYDKRDMVVQFLGKDKVRELNKVNWFYEIVSSAAPFVIFSFFAFYLATYPFGILWMVVFFFQGMVLQWFGFWSHDACIHRKVFGPRLSYIFSLIAMLPLTIPPSGYEFSHLSHHRNLNKKNDAEDYKNDIDTWWKRLFILTLFGQLLASTRLLKGKNGVINYKIQEDKYFNEDLGKKIKLEKMIMKVYFVIILILSWFFPIVLYGYLLPLIISIPFWSTARLILEHATVDDNDPLNCATYYKTNFVTAWMFFCSSGDCHLIHHLFPKIPSYNIRKALKELDPFLVKNGVIERNSLLQLFYFYFIKNLKYRTPWG